MSPGAGDEGRQGGNPSALVPPIHWLLLGPGGEGRAAGILRDVQVATRGAVWVWRRRSPGCSPGRREWCKGL